MIFRERFRSSWPAEAGLWLLIFVLPVVLVTLLHPNFHLDRLLKVVVENNAAYNALSEPEGLVHFYRLEATPLSILVNAPWALYSGLFRPLIWEVSASLPLLAALENMILLIIFISGISSLRLVSTSPHRVLVLSSVVYVVVLAVFLTLSAPNFGTLSRYGTGYIGLFAFAILCNHPAIQFVENWWNRVVRQ